MRWLTSVVVTVSLVSAIFCFLVYTLVDPGSLESVPSLEPSLEVVETSRVYPSVVPITELLPEVTLESAIGSEPPLETEPLTGKELYISYIANIVEEYYPDVDPYIVQAVMEVESNYRADVGSSAGAVGLMQVMPEYHLWRIEKYGLTDIWDPYANILCGVDLLNEAYQKYGDWSDALYVYNHSTKYVNYVLYKADILRKDGCFG